jgi:CheY-like chemotaxis protein
MRLLLVEDNELNREIATELLGDIGFAVDAAESGEDAIRILEVDRGYDALLMDIQMPGMDGYETTRAIRRSSDPYMKELPIIALTANAFDEDRQKALDSGMNEHLPKPISIKKLRQVLGEVIPKKKETDKDVGDGQSLH